MPRRRRVFSLVLLTATLALTSLSLADSTTPRTFAPAQSGFTSRGQEVLPYAPDRLLVQFEAESVDISSLGLVREKGATVPRAETKLASIDDLARSAGVLSIERPYFASPNKAAEAAVGKDRWFLFRFAKGASLPELAEKFRADPNVTAVSLDGVAFPAAIPADPLYPDHWGHNNTAQLPGLDWGGTYDHTLSTTVGTPGFDANAEAAWDGSQGYGSAGIVVAILDSGVDIDHPDLRLVAGYDFGSGDSNPDDNSSVAGHGTCCAGVAASMRNSIGAAGIAAGCSIMPCKVANNAGTMYFSSIQNALYWAADHGADIISMSLGAAISSDPATDTALQYAYNAGCVILAATGNENKSTISYPAINTYVIGVGAASPCGERKRSSSLSSECNPGVSTDPHGYTCDGERWWGSNYGANTRDAAGAVDIIAPTILPTTDIGGSGGYRSGDYEPFFNGTSCATPYAAGVCALIKSKNPTWTNAQIRDQLVNTAQDVTSVESGSGWDRYTGYGMVDAAAAVGGSTGSPPVANFTGTPTVGNVPLTVNFSDASSGSPASWSWTFGDGGTSSSQNPSHTYNAAGTYTVSLTATNAYGSDSETKTNYITVSEPGGGDYATLPYSTGFESGALDEFWTTETTYEGRIQVSTSYAPHSGSYQLLMDDSVSGGNYSQTEAWLHLDLTGMVQVDLDYWWKEFGDETHSQDGVYFSSNGGSSFVKVQNLNGASYTNQTWQHFTLDVDALCAANGLSLSSTFVVKFQQYDNYPMTSDGFAFDDISVTGVGAGDPPIAAFSGTPTAGDAPLTVVFTDASTQNPTAWSWTFGDGGTSSSQNPSHTYTVAGTYTVSLTASNVYGSDTETKTAYITVTNPAGGSWVTITYDDFEGGFGHYTDGGGDCALYSGGTYAHQGIRAADIQDNSGTASSFYHTSSYNVSGYTELEVEFWFYAVSMDRNEDFWVQYYDGSAWRTVASYTQGTSFQNGVFYNVTVTIPRGSYNYPTNAKLRFMCDASGNADDVYIDEIEFRGLTAGKSGAGLLADSGPALPDRVSLSQNYPNPFNPMTTIEFSLPRETHALLRVYDVRGQVVATLVDQVYGAGMHSVNWDARDAASGIYFYRLETPERVETHKMILLK
jgi:PKD repeat protein